MRAGQWIGQPSDDWNKGSDRALARWKEIELRSVRLASRMVPAGNRTDLGSEDSHVYGHSRID